MLDHRRDQNGRIGAYPEIRAEDVAERTIQVVEKVPDTIDSINKEAKCTRKTEEKLLGARKALEPSTQKAAIAHESAFASLREPPDKMSPGQDTLENGKESPSDLGARVEREAMPRRVSKYRVVAETSRFATHTSTVEPLWLHLWTGTNSQCE